MSRTVEILQVDAFTARPFAGNPAGVVLDAQGLPDETLRQIAAEMNVAETAFLTPATSAGADCRLRWFTPTGHEVSFCGHATIATVHALAERGRLRDTGIVFETLGGRLAAAVADTDQGPLVWLEPALPTVEPYPESLAPLLEPLRADAGDLAGWAPPALTSERDLLLPIAGLAVLHQLAPDLGRLGRVAHDAGFRGVCATARETVEPASLIHSRFFAPHYGIPEDPVTGSVHAALAVWLWQAGAIQPTGDLAAFQAEQGDVVARPGRLAVELRLRAGVPTRVRVGGRAVTVISGTIRVE